MTTQEQIDAALRASGLTPPFRRTVIRDRMYTFMARVYYRDANGTSFFLAMSKQGAAELRKR